MPSYAAFIGHQPHLSLAELAATVPGFLLHRKIDRSIVLFDSAATLDSAFLDTLGGTVMLAEKIVEEKLTTESVPELFAKLLLPVKGKVTFSLRTHGLSPATVKDLYRRSKNHLKKKGKPSRYVGNERTAAPSVVLRENGLIDGSGGSELTLINSGEDEPLWVGKTVGAQDIDAYTKRDMDKPVRDTGVGLLPPKLAQILLNLGIGLAKGWGTESGKWKVESDDKKSKNQKTETPIMVYDPFCGTGVIPMECLIRGFAVLASDKAEKAVTGCTKNLEWLRKHFEVKKSETPSKVWKHDATKPFELKDPPDVIVTETTLGPGLKDRPTVKDVQKLRSENEKIQADFLKAASESLPGVSIVCCWPVWYPSKAPVFLEKIWEVAAKLGYQAILPPTIEIVDDRMSLLYRRTDQLVGREVVLLRAKKKAQ